MNKHIILFLTPAIALGADYITLESHRPYRIIMTNTPSIYLGDVTNESIAIRTNMITFDTYFRDDKAVTLKFSTNYVAITQGIRREITSITRDGVTVKYTNDVMLAGFTNTFSMP